MELLFNNVNKWFIGNDIWYPLFKLNILKLLLSNLFVTIISQQPLDNASLSAFSIQLLILFNIFY